MVRLFGNNKSRRPTTRLGLERLEDRDVPATFTVTNLNDAGAGSLRQAIADSNADGNPDAIVFQQGLSGTITLTSGQLNVTQPVSIAGPGAANLTINANKASRVMLIDNGSAAIDNFSLSGMRLTGGVATGNPVGGGLFIGSENVALKDVEIVDNLATRGGGVWLNANGRLTMLDSFVGLNKSSVDDGAGLFLAGGTQTNIVNSTIAANTASAGNGLGGGGIFLQTGAALNVQGSTINNNFSPANAGGILVRQGATLTMRDSTVAFNQTNGFGGGIQSDRGSLTIENSTISNNDSVFQGGGVWMTGTTATIRNSTVAFNKGGKNFAVGAGGGLMIDPTVGPNSVTLQGTIVAQNRRGNGALDDVLGTVQATSAVNLIGDGTGLVGVANGVNGNLIGTTAAPIDPKLATLAFNGGKTPTHALLPGSPALDVGFDFTGTAADQRGGAFSRTVGVATDIGAFEVQPPAPTPPATPTPTTPAVVDVQVKRVGGRTRVDVKVDGTLRKRLFPFGKFKGRVQVAKADVNGDGLLDVIARATVNGKKRTRTFTT